MSKFKFNKELLDIVEDKLGIRGWVFRIVRYFLVSMLLAVLYYLIYAFIFNTKEEELLSKQNKMTSQELEKVSKKMDNLDKVIDELKVRDVEIYRGIFKANPPTLSSGGYSKNLFQQIDSSKDITIVRFTAQKVDSLENLGSEQETKIDKISGDIKNMDPDYLKAIPSVLPVEYIGPSQTGASIGRKIHPFYKTATFHTGIDLLASIGTAVVATADGQVSSAVKSGKGEGNTITITHGSDYRTVYSHLSEILVRNGQKVRRGTVIGRVGNSGLSFAPHLHYEVIFRGQKMEPINYFFAELSPSQTRDMLVVAINSGQSLD